MGSGSGMSCWRRLREWQEAGVWQRLHELLLAKLNEADLIDWSRAAIDSSHVRALGDEKTGPSPVDRFRRGSKHHLIACGRGTPLTVGLTGGNRNDITQMIPLVDAIPPVRGRLGRPRRRPQRLFGDRAYHSREGRSELRRQHIQTKIAAPKSHTAPDSTSSAGWSRAQSPGCTNTAASASATNDATTSTKPSSPSAAA
jgi:hypothetical protein